MKTGISASTNGVSSPCRTPTSPSSRGPSTANAVNGPAWLTFFGTLREAQMTLVSSAVAVIEKIDDDSAHAGISAPGGSPATTSFSGNCWRVWLMGLLRCW